MDVFDVLEKWAGLNDKDYSRARLKANYNQYVDLWRSYYNGSVVGIHDDVGFNGEKTYKIKRQSMKLPKLIAQKWATMLFTEAFQVTLKNDTETEKFRQLEKQIDFRAKLNQSCIIGYAEGTSALLASADIDTDQNTGNAVGGKVKLDMIRYDNIYPLTYDNSDIQSVAFIREEQKKDATVYTISIHTIEKDKVIVENIVATVKGDNVDFSAAETVTQSKEYNNRLYAIVKPNTLNDYSSILPFGQSIFSDSLASCDDVDLAAAGLRRDVKTGNQVVFIGRDLLLERNKDGKTEKLFDNPEGQFYTIPQELYKHDGGVKERLYDRAVPEIRTGPFWEVIKNALIWSTMTSGLGKNSLDVIPHQTATAVMTSESEKMQSKSLHEQYLECEIIQLVKGLCELSGMVGNPIDASEITITWEDSVLIDTAENKRLAMAEIDTGVISKEEYRMKFYGETPEEAAAKIEALKQQEPANNYDYMR